MNAYKPLAGLRVIEVSSFVAAPLGGMTLAQLGADVVRIDPTGGAADIARWPVAESGTSLYWTGLNKGKQSLVANLRTESGQRIVRDLVASCAPGTAVVLTNSIGQEWLSYSSLRAIAPDVIHVQVQGQPDGGAAIDYTVNAAAGFPLVTGPVDGHAPVNHVLPAWDIACGLYAALGVATAARHRDRTGEGQSLTVALSDVALAMAGNLGFLAEAQVNGVDRERVGNHIYGTFGRDFECADGRVMVVALTNRHWSDLLAATQTADRVAQLAAVVNADFSDEAQRFKHREVLCSLMEPWFAQRSMAHVEVALGVTSVVWAPYQSFAQVVQSLKEASANTEIFSSLVQPGVGEYLAPGLPLISLGRIVSAQPAPYLGQHTSSVLQQWLGLSPEAIEELRASGTVTQRQES